VVRSPWPVEACGKWLVAGGDDMGQTGREKTQAGSLGHVLGWARSMPGAGVEAGRWNGREEWRGTGHCANEGGI